MTALITQFLQFLALIVPKLVTGATAAEIANIIGILEQAIPIAIQVGEDLVNPIKNIIAVLRSSGALTPDQLDALDSQEAALDAAFDTAASAATAADAPASATPASSAT